MSALSVSGQGGAFALTFSGAGISGEIHYGGISGEIHYTYILVLHDGLALGRGRDFHAQAGRQLYELIPIFVIERNTLGLSAAQSHSFRVARQ